MLTRDDFKKDFRRRFKVIDLPSGNQARIRNLKQSEMREFRGGNFTADGELDAKRLPDANELLVAQCLVDEEGAPLFKADEVVGGCFNDASAADMETIYDHARAWIGLADSLTTLEDAVKNSASTPAGDST